MLNNILHGIYPGIFLISASMMMLQVMQSRILSITSWYHLSFLIISIAMLGLTLGALSVFKKDESLVRKNARVLMKKHCVYFGIHSLLSTIILCVAPLNFEYQALVYVSLSIVSYFVSKAYYHVGIVITIALTRTPYSTGLVYAVDLMGAGIGCLSVLVLMNHIDTPSAMILISGIIFASSLLPWGEKSEMSDVKVFIYGKLRPYTSVALSGTILCALLALFNVNSATRFMYPVFIKGTATFLNEFDVVSWNALSRVTVKKDPGPRNPFFWGSSKTTPHTFQTRYQYLAIDGGAATPISKLDNDLSSLKYLEYEMTNIAYATPGITSTAVIGVGGGRDVQAAKYFGASKVVGLDVNPVQISLLNGTYKEYTGLDTFDGVTLINAEARSWFRLNNQKFDLIQMSLIDTWATTGSGAFVLSENGLYTVEAWQTFLSSLTPTGIYTVSRWVDKSREEEMARAVSLAVEALRRMGVTSYEKHIALFQTDDLGTLLVSRNPFTQAQLEALSNEAHNKEYRVIIGPAPLQAEDKNDSIFKELIQGSNKEHLKQLYKELEFDISPATDIKPFFFNQAKFSSPISVFYNAFFNSKIDHFASGQAKATACLYIIIVLSSLAVFVTLIYPNLISLKVDDAAVRYFGTMFFALIGFGFMLTEISLMQVLGVFLGHPSYGLSVVLFSLVVFSGLGSMLSDFFILKNISRQMIWCILVSSYLVFLGSYIDTAMTQFAVTSITYRILLSSVLIAPAGLLMGMAFPSGMRLINSAHAQAGPWMWAVNGAVGVLAGSIALAISISFGINYTLYVAAAAYALLSISFLGLQSTIKS